MTINSSLVDGRMDIQVPSKIEGRTDTIKRLRWTRTAGSKDPDEVDWTKEEEIEDQACGMGMDSPGLLGVGRLYRDDPTGMETRMDPG